MSVNSASKLLTSSSPVRRVRNRDKNKSGVVMPWECTMRKERPVAQEREGEFYKHTSRCAKRNGTLQMGANVDMYKEKRHSTKGTNVDMYNEKRH